MTNLKDDEKIRLLKEQLSTEKRRVLSYRRYQESLETGYKQVIDELRKQVNWWKNNAWKSLFIKLTNMIKRR